MCLVDIGGGTTDFAVFEAGSLCTPGARCRGDHFTNDIAVGLRMPIPEAEKLKRRSAARCRRWWPRTTRWKSPAWRAAARRVSRAACCRRFFSRRRGVLPLFWDEIRRAGYEKSLNSGIVLTGGGAMLDGMAEIAEQIFDLPVRRGSPDGIGGLADHVQSPAFATSVGLVMYAHRNSQLEPARVGAGAIGRITGRLRTLFKDFF